MEEVNIIIKKAFLELKRLEAAVEIVTNLSRSSGVTYMPSGSGGTSSPNFLFKL